MVMDTKKILESIGLGATTILVLTAVGLAFYCYKNYYETVNVKLDIKLKTRQLAKES